MAIQRARLQVQALVGARVGLWLWKELPPSVEDYLSTKRGY
ncbi:hypothetical protein [Pyxidicoccus trucidator]|nr:hypothetical protein [Pyxidicoccus trucidator]